MTAMEHAELILGVHAILTKLGKYRRVADSERGDDPLAGKFVIAIVAVQDIAERLDELCPDPDTSPAPVVVFAGPDDDDDDEDDTDIFDLGGEGVVEVGGVRFGTDAA